MLRVRTIGWLACIWSGAACGDNELFSSAAGGDTTVDDRTSKAFTAPATNLSDQQLEQHLRGDQLFEAKFVTAPAPLHGGLGPLYNNTSCKLCHTNDGRGLPQISDGAAAQALVRVSLPTGIPSVPGGAVPVPELGTQLQNHAIFGVTPEVTVELAWVESVGAFADGAPYTLRRPLLRIARPNAASLPSDMRTSFRIAPAVFGLGLLEAIAQDDVLAAADPNDSDGDGISGRANYVWSPTLQRTELGRFGWKANTATLDDQAGAAFANDMGVTSPFFAAGTDAPELAQADIAATSFYTATLAVPTRAPQSAAAKRGSELFRKFACSGCHTPEQRSGAHPVSALANQTFAPFTDLLLHDMGPALADGRPDFLADGNEWRTPPLWGLGLVQTVLPGASYLHDGRARTIVEAIMWHGGEAARSRAMFAAAPTRDREALLAFLATL